MTLTDDRSEQPTRVAAAVPPGPPQPAPSSSAPAASRGPVARPIWEQCDRCQAPVEPAQRYCVVCGTGQRRPDDPAARYLASARRAKLAPATVAAPPARAGVSTTVAALLIALLPIAAGLGVVVGRGSNDSGDQVIEALKAARGVAPAGVAAPAAGPATAGTATTAAGEDDAAKDEKAEDEESRGPKVDGVETSTKQAPVIASGPTGDARQLEGTKPTKKDIEESKEAVDQINSRKGKAYIDTQRDLPDSIVIP